MAVEDGAEDVLVDEVDVLTLVVDVVVLTLVVDVVVLLVVPVAKRSEYKYVLGCFL